MRIISVRLRLVVAIVTVSVVSLSLCRQTHAGVVYDQPAVFPSSNAFYSWTSTYDPQVYGSIWTTYDNFSIGQTTAIGSLTWQGFSFDDTTSTSTSVPVQSFNIQFYTDSSGIPGNLVYSENVGFTQAVAGTLDFFNNGSAETFYNYSASLPVGFIAQANTTYWISIQGVSDLPGFWSWTEGTGGDGQSYQYLNPSIGSVATYRTGDRTFTLYSAPEPSTISLSLFAVASGAIIALQKRRRSA